MRFGGSLRFSRSAASPESSDQRRTSSFDNRATNPARSPFAGFLPRRSARLCAFRWLNGSFFRFCARRLNCSLGETRNFRRPRWASGASGRENRRRPGRGEKSGSTVGVFLRFFEKSGVFWKNFREIFRVRALLALAKTRFYAKIEPEKRFAFAFRFDAETANLTSKQTCVLVK